LSPATLLVRAVIISNNPGMNPSVRQRSNSLNFSETVICGFMLFSFWRILQNSEGPTEGGVVVRAEYEKGTQSEGPDDRSLIGVKGRRLVAGTLRSLSRHSLGEGSQFYSPQDISVTLRTNCESKQDCPV